MQPVQGWALAELASAVDFRGCAGLMPDQGPAIYVAGVLGQEDAWKKEPRTGCEHMFPAAGLQLTMLGLRDVGVQAQAARVMHGVLSGGVDLWAC